MNCEVAQRNIVLVSYGELADEEIHGLERHLAECEECRKELAAMRALMEAMAYTPVMEPSPNMVAQSRMQLDEALDQIPARGWLNRLGSSLFGWVGHVQSAPALTTLLVGVGFLAGNFTYRYQAAHAPKLPTPVILSNSTNGVIANVSGIVQTPNSDIVQVKYNRMIPEVLQGSLDDPQIRQLLTMGTTMPPGMNGVRDEAVPLLASECKAGHACEDGSDGKGIRNALLVSLRYDKNPGVRLKALEGLQPYVGQDQRVRDAVLEALLQDSNAGVRTRAISLLEPVQADASVRQVLRTVSTQDENPYIRTASYQALQGTADIQ